MPRTDVTPSQIKRAKSLRLSMTGSEKALWQMLKGGRMYDCHFRRQAPIGPYVVDIVCHSHHLVIEADGDHHGHDKQRLHDTKRDQWLAGQGYRVLRFSNPEILQERESVGSTIEAAIEDRLPEDVYAAVPGGFVVSNAPSQPSPTGGEGLKSALAKASSPPLWGRDREGARTAQSTIKLRPLFENDLVLLHRWHGAAHLRPFYMQDDISLSEIERKFTPRLSAPNSVRCRIAEADGKPYGFIQWYASRDWKDCGAYRAGLIDGVSADYFIGDAAFLGKGLAAEMLRLTVSEIMATTPPLDSSVCLSHDERNICAIRAATAAGFSPEADIFDRESKIIIFVRRVGYD